MLWCNVLIRVIIIRFNYYNCSDSNQEDKWIKDNANESILYNTLIRKKLKVQCFDRINWKQNAIIYTNK